MRRFIFINRQTDWQTNVFGWQTKSHFRFLVFPFTQAKFPINISLLSLSLQTAFMNWTVATESHVDSSFFWGYLITQIPGGFIASKFPANKIFGLSIASSATLHLFVPFAMTLMHGHVVICVRVLQGLFEVSNTIW